MLNNILSKLLGKDNLSEGIPNIKSTTNYINEIEKILKIESITVIPVVCIYGSQGYTYIQTDFGSNDYPNDARFDCGYYDEKNSVYIAHMISDSGCGIPNFRVLTEAEKLFVIAHELRHVWQKKHDAKTYFKTTALGLESLEDIAEIDADAFAYCYSFSDKTPFSQNDLDFFAEELSLRIALDNGKRMKRISELEKEYGLSCNEKLSELRHNILQKKNDEFFSAYRKG